MNKEELTKLVLDVINNMNVMTDRNEPAKPSDYFDRDLWFDSLDTTELTYDLANELNKEKEFIQETDIEEFWLSNYGYKTVQQLIDYVAEHLKIKD